MGKELQNQNRFVDDAAFQSARKNADGRSDPDGIFPRPEYVGTTSVGNKATGAKESHVYLGGATEGMDLELKTEAPTQYPLNQVKETISGHVVEYDDTAGRERMMFRHKSGSGVEMRADGTVIYSSTENTIRITASDEKVIVEGDGEIVYNGNLKLKVAGDFDLQVGGNFTTSVAGDIDEVVKGNKVTDIAKNKDIAIQGNNAETVLGTKTETVLGNVFLTHKGNLEHDIQGISEVSVGDEAILTAENGIVISSLDINMAASSLTVIGDSGTVGGANIIHYGHTAHIPRINATSVHASQGVIASVGMTAPTFNGNLSGNASTAGKSAVATALGAGAGSAQGTVTITPAADSNPGQPNSTVMLDYLNQTNLGIRRLDIDPFDDFKNAVNRAENYGGISSVDLSTALARSKLRDPNNLKNQAFTGALVTEGIISSNFAVPVVPKFGRVVGPEKTPRRGTESIGSQDGRVQMFT
tara:strand:+ start:7107 stop:8519 length:1413 start_codon:yes stop_codon:yes gene_type:complete